MKAYLKEHDKEIQCDNVEEFVLQAFCTITVSDCEGWYRHAGYE